MAYRVFITPLESDRSYGNAINVTNDLSGGIPNIKSSIDNSDFSVGIFSYNSIRLKLNNNHERYRYGFSAYNSIFPVGRDRAKVTIDFEKDDGDIISIFHGLIDDIATKEDDRRFLITFRVLSVDSIIRKHSIPSAQVTTGMTFKNALYTILNTYPINDLLNVDLNNISVQYDDIIDNGGWFTSRPAKRAVDLLLLACGSILYVDSNLNIIVRPRNVKEQQKEILYGAIHPLRRRPVIYKMRSINTGQQRIFNSILVNNVRVLDQLSVDHYGLKEREPLEIPFIIDPSTSYAIGEIIINEFRFAREELLVTVLSEAAHDLNLTDIVRIDHPRFVTRGLDQKLFDLYGSSLYGQATYPMERGRTIDIGVSWIVYEKRERASRFRTELKLRKFGTSFGDEFIPSNLYAAAEYGESEYAEDSDAFVNPLSLTTPYGLGRYGVVEYQGP